MNNPNFQNMQMMGQGQQRANQASIINHYRSQQGKAPPGWQQSVQPEERATPVLQFFSSFRLLKPEATETEAMRTAIQFETHLFNTTASKDQWFQELRKQLLKMQSLRQARLSGMQNNLAHGMNTAQQAMMNQNAVQGARPNPGQQFPPGFPNPQLQRPMQPSPIPMTQAQSSMGMNGTNAMNFAQAPNTPQPNAPQSQPPSQQPDNNAIMQVTRKLMQQAKPEVVVRFRQDVESWPADRRQHLVSQGIDPLLFRFRQQAEVMLRSGKINMAALQGAQGANQGGGTMQQNGQPNQQMNMNQRQPNQDFDFNALANQQIEALRVQDQGQQVVPASNNPNANQMGFPGQNQQQGQNMAQRQAAQAAAFNNANLRQAQVQQAQAQARAQLQQQQQAAQVQQAQQAAQRNPNQMLQGQIGGLNLPPGTQQSPAMPMLTRPMVPPGQAGPATPQQRPQAHVPVMGNPTQPQFDPQVASQLMREVQQRAAAAQNAGQPLNEQARLTMLPAEMPQQVKAQMLKLPEPQFRAMLVQYANNMRRNALQNGQFPGGQPGPGQPNMMMNPSQALQMSMSNQMINGANMGGTPGMPLGQPTPNAMNGQQLPMGQRQVIPQQQRLASAQNILQQSPGIITATDNIPFPPNVLNAQIKQALPGDIKTWAQLKQWASQNPALMPNIDAHKLLLLQVLHFQDQMMRKQQLNASVTPNAQQNGRGPIAHQPPQTTQTSLPAQTQRPQQPPNMAAMGPIQATPQEIQAFRDGLQPGQQAPSEDQIRNYLTAQKLNQRKAQLANQHMMNVRRSQSTQQPGVMAAPGPQVSRPQPAPQQPVAATSQPKAASKPQQPPKPAQSNGQANVTKGVKRPNDDTAEPSNETPAANAAPQAPTMVATKSQHGVPNLTQEQIAKLPPNQQAQMRAQLLKAQDASNNKQQQRPLLSMQEISAKMSQPEMQQKIRAMLKEEDEKAPRGQPVQLAPESRAHLQQAIHKQYAQIRKVEQALRVFIASYEGDEMEQVARNIMRSRTALLKNMNPPDGRIYDEVTLTAQEFRENIIRVLNFVNKVMARFQGQGNATQQTQQQQPAGPQTQSAVHQLNAENLKINEQEHRQRQQKAPPAPVTDRPPFQLGAQSPRGAPTYFEGAPKVENLRLPDKKKPRLDSQASTPGTKQSPRIGTGKTGSPELKRQPPPQKPVEQKPLFKCTNADCDHHVRGFETQAELEAHIKEAHAKIDDPVQFALDSMADILEVDSKTGQSKIAAANRTAKPHTTLNRAPQSIKSGQTPSLSQNVTTPAAQQAAATPMTRVPTQPGIKSSPSTNLLRTPQTGPKVATPSTGAPTKATPSSVTKLAAKETRPVIIPEAQKEEAQQAFAPLSLFDFSYDDVYGALDTNGPFTVLDLKDEDPSWVLRDPSPMNTPDSSPKDTPSTRQSDISENDNLQINLDIKPDMDMPDAWLAALGGEPLPLDVQLSEDIQNLGVTLPPMNDDDMMLFYGTDNYLNDLDAMDPKMMESLGTLDPSVLGMS